MLWTFFRSGKKRKAADVPEPAAKRAKAANGVAVPAKKDAESSEEESSDEEAAPVKQAAAGAVFGIHWVKTNMSPISHRPSESSQQTASTPYRSLAM